MAEQIYQTIQGEEVPALGLGTWKLDGEACRRGVAEALEMGYRHIDTAQVYENEAEVGQGLQDAAGVDRDDVFLVTKIWPENLAPGNVRASAEESLKKLGTDYVDLLHVHWPAGAFEMEGTMEAMSALREAGKARHLGVSNFTPELVEEALSHAPLFAVQVEYHPFLSQHALARTAREHDLLLTAYSPLARGKVLDDDLLQAIGDAHGKTAAQVALRWLVQQNKVAAIPKASSTEHRRSNFDLFDFALSDEEMQGIFDLARGERIIHPDDLAPAAWSA